MPKFHKIKAISRNKNIYCRKSIAMYVSKSSSVPQRHSQVLLCMTCAIHSKHTFWTLNITLRTWSHFYYSFSGRACTQSLLLEKYNYLPFEKIFRKQKVGRGRYLTLQSTCFAGVRIWVPCSELMWKGLEWRCVLQCLCWEFRDRQPCGTCRPISLAYWKVLGELERLCPLVIN